MIGACGPLGITREIILESTLTFTNSGLPREDHSAPADRQSADRQVLGSALDRPVVEKIGHSTNACRVLENERFAKQIEQMIGRRVRLKKRGRPSKNASG